MELPKAEEQVMRYLWKLKKTFMKGLLKEYPEPKPASTTVSTLIKRLHNKGYIGYRTIGKSREYFPKIKQSDYFSNHMNILIKDFFNNSAAQFASFLTSKVEFTEKELKELRNILDKQIKNKEK